MKNRINKSLKIGFLFLGILLFLVNCEQESVIEQQDNNSELIENGKNDKIKTGKFNDLKELKSFLKKIKEERKNKLSKTSIEDNNNFTILEDKDIFILTDSTATTYTLAIQKENHHIFGFSNLVVKFSNANPTTAFILNYVPSQEYLNAYSIANQTPFQGTINYESIDYDGSLDDLNARRTCHSITLTYCNYGGEIHSAGENCTPSFMFDITYDICYETTDNSPINNSIDPPSGPNGGGGGTPNSNPTIPLPVNTCESLSGSGDIGITGSNGDCYDANTINTYNLLNQFIDDNNNSQEAHDFINELTDIINLDENVDNNALQFMLEAKTQNKIHNDFDNVFLNTVNQYMDINSTASYPGLIQLQIYFATKCAVLKFNNPTWSNTKIYWETSKDIVHITLDVFGLIPVIGEIADLTNGVLYTIEGDGVNATLSYASEVPIAGWAAAGTKFAIKIVDASQTVYSIGTKVKLTWKVLANGTIYFGSTGSKLRKVLGITDSALHAHHLIPWATRNFDVVQKAAKSGNAFHINEALNGIPRPSNLHLTGHNHYNDVISDILNEFNPNASIDEAYDFVSGFTNHIRTLITNNPTLNSGQIADLISYP